MVNTSFPATGSKIAGYKYPKPGFPKIKSFNSGKAIGTKGSRLVTQRASQTDKLINQRGGLASVKVPKFKKKAKYKKHRKNWIAGAIKHPGALHRQLGVKVGHKIPIKRLNAAAKKGGKLGARARLAKTLKELHS